MNVKANAYVLGLMALVSTHVACSSSADESPPAAATLHEPVVFDASSETQTDVGIARWGFEGDEDHLLSTFRGYDAQNQLLVEVKEQIESLDAKDPSHVRLTIAMTGPMATARHAIDFAEVPVDNGTVFAMMVLENTFQPGSIAKRMLDHMGADARSSEDSASTQGSGSGSGSLVSTRTRPLASDKLVETCQELVLACNRPLIRYEIAVAAMESACSSTELIGKPVAGAVVGGVTVGIIGSVFPAVGTAVGAVAGAVGGAAAGAGSAAYGCWSSVQDHRTKEKDLQQCKKKNNVQCD